MSGTSTEISTESMDEMLPQTAHEAARAYEDTSNDRPHSSTPDSTPSKISPDGITVLPDSHAPSETASLPDSSAPGGTTALPDSPAPGETTALPDSPAPGETASLPNSPVSDNTASSEAPSNPPTNKIASQPEALPSPPMSLQNNLRLRMKVWTDPNTLKRYLMPMAFMRDLVNGQPVSDIMYAYAMSDDNTKVVTLTAGAWNTLPFFYFQEDGHAPRTAIRPMDSIP